MNWMVIHSHFGEEAVPVAFIKLCQLRRVCQAWIFSDDSDQRYSLGHAWQDHQITVLW